MNNRALYKLNAITGTKPPMYKHVSPRRCLFEVLRYEMWLNRRHKLSSHKTMKLPKLKAEMTFKKQFWINVL